MPKGTCRFNKSWLSVEAYQGWVACATSPLYAGCTICMEDINFIAGMEGALGRHSNGKAHGDLRNELNNSSKSLAAH